MTKQLTGVRPELVEGPFVELRTGFDRLSPNGGVTNYEKISS